jgi:hypothetical protein
LLPFDITGQVPDSFASCESQVYYDPSTQEIEVCHGDQNVTHTGIPMPLPLTQYSFAPAILAAELFLTNIMMLSVLIAVFK